MNVTEQLKESALFKGIEIAGLEALVQAMKPQSFPEGAVLFEKDDPGDTMYIILSGKLRIYTHDQEGNLITLTYFGATRIFGEFALLDQQPRSASAAAVEPLEVLALHRSEFLEFLPKYPAVGLAMLRNLTDRVRYITVYQNKIKEFAERISQGEYEQAIRELTAASTDDGDIQGMIAAFVQMVHSVQEREKALNGQQ